MRVEVTTGLGARIGPMAFPSVVEESKIRANVSKNWPMFTLLLRSIERQRRFANLGKADADVGAFFQMDGIDKAHLTIVERENHRHRADAFAEKADAFEQIPVGDTAAGKDNFLSRREIFRVVDAFGILHAHALEALGVLRFAHYEPRKNLSIEAAQSCRGDDTFRGAA